MLLWNTIKLAHMTLRLVPEILNAVDMILLVCKEFGMIDPKMLEIRDIQHVVTSPTIRIDNTVGYYFFLYDGVQSR